MALIGTCWRVGLAGSLHFEGIYEKVVIKFPKQANMQPSTVEVSFSFHLGGQLAKSANC